MDIDLSIDFDKYKNSRIEYNMYYSRKTHNFMDILRNSSMYCPHNAKLDMYLNKVH